MTLAIKAVLPPLVYDHFKSEKARAEEAGDTVLTEFNGVQLHLKKHGGQGYEFIASGGPHAANWSFKKPNAKDPWGIRVNLGSELLALYGLGGAKAHLEDVLDRLGIRYAAEDVSLARVDVCVDILAPDFRLVPDHFVIPASANRKDYWTEDSIKVNGKSGRVTSVTVGASGNRQVIIYDKRREVTQLHKKHWWTIWEKSLDRQIEAGHLPPGLTLDPSDPRTSRIWRVEMRAGKRLLKDRWNIRTWEDLFERGGDVFRETGELIRYCEPNGDTNRARWPNHPMWEIALAEINDDLTEMRSGVDPQTMKEVHREEHIRVMIRNIRGSALTYAALKGCDLGDLPDQFADLTAELTEDVRLNPDEAAKQLQAGKDRYVFVEADRARG